MYMYHFGGVYADLDLVPLGTLSDHIPILNHDTAPPMPIAYLGHMGDDNYAHSIPNAFMVSTTPGHPFWLGPLEFIKEHLFEDEYNAQPEGLTGPVALRTCYRQWEAAREEREGEGHFAEVRVLSNEKVGVFCV
jgi:mannosyltransferase OCH1-like enzyme